MSRYWQPSISGYSRAIIFIFLLTYLFSPPNVLGHGADVEQTQIVEQYRFEFSYENPEVYADELTAFTFRVEDATTGELRPYDALFIRFSRGANPVLVATLSESPLFGGSSLVSAVLPDEGEYDVSVTIQEGGKSLAEASFHFSVLPPFVSMGESERSLSSDQTIFFGTSLLAVLGAGIFLGRRMIATTISKT